MTINPRACDCKAVIESPNQFIRTLCGGWGPAPASALAFALGLLMTTFGTQVPAAPSSSSAKPDLSSPEATVRSFTKAAARGETHLVLACFLPGGVDYEDMRKVMQAEPGTPPFEMKAMMGSLDLDRPMPIVQQQDTENGTKVVWRVTFKKQFKPSKGPIFKPGSTYDLDATLKKVGDHWLIDNF